MGALPSVLEGGAFDFSLIILRRFHLIRLKRAFRFVLPRADIHPGCGAVQRSIPPIPCILLNQLIPGVVFFSSCLPSSNPPARCGSRAKPPLCVISVCSASLR